MLVCAIGAKDLQSFSIELQLSSGETISSTYFHSQLKFYYLNITVR